MEETYQHRLNVTATTPARTATGAQIKMANRAFIDQVFVAGWQVGALPVIPEARFDCVQVFPHGGKDNPAVIALDNTTEEIPKATRFIADHVRRGGCEFLQQLFGATFFGPHFEKTQNRAIGRHVIPSTAF